MASKTKFQALYHMTEDKSDGRGMAWLYCGEERRGSSKVVERGTFEKKPLHLCCPGCAKRLAIYIQERLIDIRSDKVVDPDHVKNYKVRLDDGQGNHAWTVHVVARCKEEADRFSQSVHGMKSLQILTEEEWCAEGRSAA